MTPVTKLSLLAAKSAGEIKWSDLLVFLGYFVAAMALIYLILTLVSKFGEKNQNKDEAPNKTEIKSENENENEGVNKNER